MMAQDTMPAANPLRAISSTATARQRGGLRIVPWAACVDMHNTPIKWGSAMMDGYGFGFGHGLGILFWILILLGVVVAAGFLARGLGSRTTFDQPPPDARSPLDILKERYAKGEIDHEEYHRRKRDLET
jgi:putative membrane protein